jgi:Transposase IS4
MATLLPTPNSTQQSTQSTNSFVIYEDEPTARTEPASESNEPPDQKKVAWEVKYKALKRQSKTSARDYLVELIGHDDYPEILRNPSIPPKVLLEEDFTVEDPLRIWRQFISEQDLRLIAEKTNENARIAAQRYARKRPLGTRRRARRWKALTTVEISAYFGALYLLRTQGAASLVDNWSTLENSPIYQFGGTFP